MLKKDLKKNAELKIIQMKENALKDIKNISIKVSIESVQHLIKNSIETVHPMYPHTLLTLQYLKFQVLVVRETHLEEISLKGFN